MIIIQVYSASYYLLSRTLCILKQVSVLSARNDASRRRQWGKCSGRRNWNMTKSSLMCNRTCRVSTLYSIYHRFTLVHDSDDDDVHNSC